MTETKQAVHAAILMSLPRCLVHCCVFAILFLWNSISCADGRTITIKINGKSTLHCRDDRRHLFQRLPSFLTPNLSPREDYDLGLSSYNRNNKQTIWLSNRSFATSHAFSIRGGADNEKAPEHDVDTKLMIEDETEQNFDVVSSAANTTKGSNESVKPKTFLSFFRPVSSSSPPAAATVLNKKNVDKIPHGPTGGGYATMTANSEECQEDGDLIMASNKLSAVSEDVNKEGTSILSTYPAAFAINQGSQSMRVAYGKTAIETKTQIDPYTLKPNMSSLAVSPTELDNKTQSTLQNQTQKLLQGDIVGPVNTTSIKSDLQTSNLSDVNLSIRESISGKGEADYTSSGYWVGIDLISSFGLSTLSEELKISKVLRPFRKAAAQATGLHGFLSGKPSPSSDSDLTDKKKRQPTVITIDEELGIHDSTASEAEVTARKLAKPLTRRQQKRMERRAANRHLKGRRWGFRRGNNPKSDPEYIVIPVRVLDESPDALERRRRKRVEEIDKLLIRGSARLMELQCEKDDLQQAPNPLFNYTKKYDESANKTFGDVRTSREFNFPPSNLVEDYIEELVSSGRLICLNHTDLWQNNHDDDIGDDEVIGDDLFTPSADASRLYQNLDQFERGIRKGTKNSKSYIHVQNSGGGSWLLRTGFRNGGSLGEKLGETIETQAYKAVTASVMMALARILSALHGINIMSHSDIRLYIEDDPDLPPINKEFGSIGRGNYAQQAIKTAIQKGQKKRKHSSKSSSHSSSRRHGHELSDAAFIQRDAVVETLISHCQISAPLLKLFPIDWQRAIVGNIITLVTAIISDFADGIQLQILGHSLSFSFKPITEADIFQNIGVGSFRQNHRQSRPDEFEYAVWATAQDISNSMSFDGWLGWLEKKLGGGILISQLSNLIARVVLTLIDEVLSGARLDLWSPQANGPRLYAALEYRTTNLHT